MSNRARAKRFVRHQLARVGLAVHFVPRWEREGYGDGIDAIAEAREAQTEAAVHALRSRYERPVFGRIDSWELIRRLASCVDPSDPHLGCASQEIHVLQVLEGMERAGVSDPVLLTAALLHDVGKVLLLTEERADNIVGMVAPIGEQPPAIGLDRALLQWGHDEFAYSRLREHVRAPVAWLIRYHSIDLTRCAPLMDANDRELCRRYLLPFRRFDFGTKSKHVLPKRRIEDYRELLRTCLPPTLEI